jgi:hypothetical protein
MGRFRGSRFKVGKKMKICCFEDNEPWQAAQELAGRRYRRAIVQTAEP